MDFNVPVGVFGDCFDRYILRIYEIKESLRIMKQCLSFLFAKLLDNNIFVFDFKINSSFRSFIKFSMESLINHFKMFTEGFSIKKEEIYFSVEAPKGEFGVYLVSDDTNKPYRCRIKAPGFLHLQGLNFMCKGHFLADLVTIIGTQDIVFVK